MTRKVVKYLMQQTLDSGKRVAVLTPYLRQLFLLREALSTDWQVLISDMNMEDLQQEGLSAQCEPETAPKPPIGVRLSTVTISRERRRTWLLFHWFAATKMVTSAF